MRNSFLITAKPLIKLKISAGFVVRINVQYSLILFFLVIYISILLAIDKTLKNLMGNLGRVYPCPYNYAISTYSET